MAQCHNSINFEVWRKKLFKVSFFLDIGGVVVKYEIPFWSIPNLLSLSAVEGFQNEATNPIQHEKSFVIIFLPWFYDYGSQTSSLCQNICENFFGHTWFLYTCLPYLVFFTLLGNKCWWKHKMRERDDVGIIRFFAQWLVPNIYQKFLFQFVIICPIKKKIAILISDSFTAALTAIWHDKRVSFTSGSIISNAYYQWLWIV